METSNVIQEVTNKIIALLDKVTKGDIQYWIPLSGMAYNPFSKHTYSSLNQLLLSLELYESNYNHNNWLTFKQITKAGGTVIKDEKATMITFSEIAYYDKEGKNITLQEAKQAFLEAQAENSDIMTYRDAGINSKRFLKLYYVFNVAQTDGLAEELIQGSLFKLNDIERYTAADKVAEDTGAKIVHVAANSAHYDPGKDKIQMPSPKQFTTPESYYGTLFHELVHWSGHKQRLNRTFGKKESPEYAFEELIAELGSTFICAQLNIKASLTSSAAYLKSWLNALENDRNYLIKAVSYADRAMNYLLAKQSIGV